MADVVEAIIGAAFLSGGQTVALKAMKTLNIAIPSIEHWSDFARINGRSPAPARNFVPLVDVKALEAIVCCEIKNRDIFAQALVGLLHESHVTVNPDTSSDTLVRSRTRV